MGWRERINHIKNFFIIIVFSLENYLIDNYIMLSISKTWKCALAILYLASIVSVHDMYVLSNRPIWL